MPDGRRPVVAIIQARMASTRLPGKVLRQVAGRSLLAHLVERLRAAHLLDRIAVATSVGPADDAVVAECARMGVPVTRGSEADVLGRFAHAAAAHDASTVVRLTADCPLMDPAEVDRVVGTFLAAPLPLDYATNQLPGQRKVPLGLAVEVFSRAALDRADREAREPHQREHVTPYLYDSAGRFRTLLVDHPHDLAHLRITVDTPEDLAVVAPVLEALDGRSDAFALAATVAFLEANPAIAARNASIRQKAHTETAVTDPASPRPAGNPMVCLLMRADATAQGGTGHVMRQLGLGQAWLRQGGRAVLHSAGLDEALSVRVRAAGIEVVPMTELPGTTADAVATRSLARAVGADAVLVDGYGFSPHFLQQLREPGRLLACIDDFGVPDLPVDVVVRPNAGAAAPADHPWRALLAGTPFTPVRQDFRDAPRPTRRFDHAPLHLLLTFGGSDPARMTLRALAAALHLAQENPLRLTVLLGPCHPDIATVVDLARASPTARVLHDVQDMPALLADVDLACTAAGTTCWELATLGVPMLLVPVADNQAVVVRGITAAGAGIALPPAEALDDAMLQAGLRRFLAAGAETHAAWSAAGMRLIDGHGADRIVAAIARVARETAR